MRLIRTALALLLGPVSCTTAQTASTSAFRREILAAHNQVRSRVGVPPLTWSSELASVARQWANQLLSTGKFAHRPKPQYGENLFEIVGARATPARVVADWAAEAEDYDAGRNACRPGSRCGHYTQLVARRTNQVGCAVAHGKTREVWVCNYNPPGNVVGERPF